MSPFPCNKDWQDQRRTFYSPWESNYPRTQTAREQLLPRCLEECAFKLVYPQSRPLLGHLSDVFKSHLLNFWDRVVSTAPERDPTSPPQRTHRATHARTHARTHAHTNRRIFRLQGCAQCCRSRSKFYFCNISRNNCTVCPPHCTQCCTQCCIVCPVLNTPR